MFKAVYGKAPADAGSTRAKPCRDAGLL